MKILILIIIFFLFYMPLISGTDSGVLIEDIEIIILTKNYSKCRSKKVHKTDYHYSFRVKSINSTHRYKGAVSKEIYGKYQINDKAIITAIIYRKYDKFELIKIKEK